ncbi:small G protein signaling modulator 2 [Diaphorina citri]|uniref:Small G protein signaling modulator 2 n=1 Tax=Diaphorina citri TaxID=121845 RepID=A0A3Q0IPV4_DIACI|nr:small G protein signaling modulator 2 [Diaphorina citri]
MFGELVSTEASGSGAWWFEYKSNQDNKDVLIRNVKKEVKQIMEEAVTRKFVHQDSGTITSFCGAVEACLSQGLRRRALGLFKTSSTTALLHKIGKYFEPAGLVSRQVQELEGAEGNRRLSSSGEQSKYCEKPPLLKKTSSGSSAQTLQVTPLPKYLWIRLALFERVLASIIDYLVQNASKYYESDSLVADPDCGSILGSLLVGPCALEYSRTKTSDHYWTDPPPDWRQLLTLAAARVPSGGRNHQDNKDVLIRNVKKEVKQIMEEAVTRKFVHQDSGTITSFCEFVDYVESLHQNSRATLLYGKNNVLVCPKDVPEPMAGYLSLHQTSYSLTIKWTPNQLMKSKIRISHNQTCLCFQQYGRSLNAKSSEEIRQQPSVASAKDYVESLHQNSRATLLRRVSLPDETPRPTRASTPPPRFRRYSTKSHVFMYWDYAMNVNLDEVVYVHCHQKSEGEHGGTIVLVGQDGVQRPPIIFPKGGHLLAFLSCLENGLLPHGQLDPPLWSQRGKGKVFPKLRRKSRLQMSKEEPSIAEEESVDYVFQIIGKKRREDIMGSHELWQSPLSRSSRVHLASTSSSSTSSNKSISIDHSPLPLTPPPHVLTGNFTDSAGGGGSSLQLVCDTMKRQIISRAFYGWLAYCRHLRTVRTHLSGLVHMDIIPGDGAEGGVTREVWRQLVREEDGFISDQAELFRLAYYGGVDPALRKEVWPFLLGHYLFHSTRQERQDKDRETKQLYETTMSEWLAVEAIVRQKDKETMAMNLAKLSSESTSGTDTGPQAIPTLDNNLSNDVFEDNVSSLSDDSDDPPVVDEYQDALEYDQDSNPQPFTTEDVQNNIPEVVSATVEKETGKPLSHQDSRSSATTRSESPDEGVGEEMEEEENKPPPEETQNSPATTNGDDENPGANDTPNEVNQEDGCADVNVQEYGPLIKPCLISITSNQSVDSGHMSSVSDTMSGHGEQAGPSQLTVCMEGEETCGGNRSNCISPASSQGGVYSTELLESFGLNLHRIDKDVLRCDRNYHYFTPENLDKLRNIMCTYVWEHLDVGYMQGMCDLVAPILVILDDESLTYSCFCCLMDRMAANFPTTGGVMDNHFANMRKNPMQKVVWHRETMRLETTERRIMETRGSRHTLMIRKVVASDFGNYSCEATNPMGKHRAYLELSGKPNPAIFRSHPQGRLPNSYNITWMVSSYTPLEEFKIKYRKIPGNEPSPMSNQLTGTNQYQNRRLVRKVRVGLVTVFSSNGL